MNSGLSRLNPPKKKRRPNPLSAISSMVASIIGMIIGVFLTILINTSKIIIQIIQLISNIVLKVLGPLLSVFSKIVKTTFYRIGSLFPFHLREKLEELFLYSGLVRNPEETLGMTFLYSIVIPAGVGILGYLFIEENITLALVLGIASFAFVWVMLFMVLNLLVDKRTDNIEKVLPDMLSMIAQNMSAGMTPYNALWVAARPEFGALAEEIQKVARDTLTGTPLETALINMGNRVQSGKLKRTIKLMIQGMRSGGELPTVLQEISRDIRTEQNLIRRMESETTSQVMFILFALILGAPLLFSASAQFVNIFSKTLSMIDVESISDQSQGGMVSLQELPITEDQFVFYAIVTLTVCSFFGSLIIGLMKSGKLTKGIPIAPVAIGLSVGMLLLLRFGLNSFFGGMMTV